MTMYHSYDVPVTVYGLEHYLPPGDAKYHMVIPETLELSPDASDYDIKLKYDVTFYVRIEVPRSRPNLSMKYEAASLALQQAKKHFPKCDDIYASDVQSLFVSRRDDTVGDTSLHSVTDNTLPS